MKLILIEDNKKIADNIKEYLNAKWFFVDVFYNGTEWFESINKKKYDIILLDIMLPDINWVELCKNIRKKYDTPIIMITARWDVEDKITWLESWADDYIVKPFDIKELIARINALSRRTDIKENIKFKDVIINFNKRIIQKWNENIHLTNTEFLILEYIYKSKLVSRTDLIEYIWWDDLFSHDAKLDVHIHQIRKKIYNNIILTEKWYGYKWWWK